MCISVSHFVISCASNSAAAAAAAAVCLSATWRLLLPLQALVDLTSAAHHLATERKVMIWQRLRGFEIGASPSALVRKDDTRLFVVDV